MIPLLASPFAQRLAWTLLHFLWQGALLGLLAWLAFTLLRHGRPQVRYLLGCAFLLACLGSAATTLLLLAPPSPSAQVSLASPRPPDLAIVEPNPVDFSDMSAPSTARPWQTHLQPFLPWILAAWVTGVLGLSLRAAGGWLWLRRIKGTATPVAEPEWLPDLVRRTGLRRAVRFLESVRVATPLCLGLLRPVVLLPLGFFANLDPLAAEAVLAHELAHIRRLDGLVNGLQCAIEVLFFFHPAVGWLSRRIRTEREHCCDDAAVLACGDAVFYAETLSRLDVLRDRPPSLALSARGGNLMERMRRLLLSDPPQFRFSTPGLSLLAAFVLTITLPAQAEKSRPLPTTAGEPPPVVLLPETGPPRADRATSRVLPPVDLVPILRSATRSNFASDLPEMPQLNALPPASPQAAPPQASPVDPPIPIRERPAATPSGVTATKTQGGLPVLKGRELPIATDRVVGFALLPSFSAVIEDEITEGREHFYTVKVPAQTSIRIQAHSETGAAYLRLKAYGRNGVRAKGPMLPEATFTNEGNREMWFSFTVGFDRNYSGGRRITLRETVSDALPGRAHASSQAQGSMRSESLPDPTLEGSLPQTAPDLGPEPTAEEALAYIKIMAERSLWGPRTQIEQVKVLGKSRWYSSLTNRWPGGKDAETIVGWEIAFLAKPSQVMAPNKSKHLRSILVDKDGVVYWRTHTQYDNTQNIMPK